MTAVLDSDCGDPLLMLSVPGEFTMESFVNPSAATENIWDVLSDSDLSEPNAFEFARASTFGEVGIEAEAEDLGYRYEEPRKSFDATAIKVPFLSSELIAQAGPQETVEKVARAVLAHIGKGNTMEIYECAKKYNLLKDSTQKPEKLRGDFTNRINQDRKRPAPMFGNKLKAHRATYFLTEFGRKITATDFGIFSINEIPNSDIPFDNAIERILTTYGVMSREEIAEAFVRDGYCTKTSAYKVVDEAKVIRDEIFNPWIGQTLNSAQRMEENSRAATSDRNVFRAKCFRGYWWIAGHDYHAQLFAKLEEQNPHRELGAQVFQARVQMRVEERVGKKAKCSEDRLRSQKVDQKSAYDMRDDALNLWIPHHFWTNFFEQRKSTIRGAGDGFYAKVDLPAYTCLEVFGDRIPTKENEWHPYAFGYTEQDGSHWTVLAGTAESGASCAAAMMNDSLVGQQFSCHQIVVDNTTIVYLMNEQTIKAGEECFFGYGDDYWNAAPFTPTQAPVVPQTQCSKKRAAYVPQEPQSKRNKGSCSLSPGILPEPLFSSEELSFF